LPWAPPHGALGVATGAIAIGTAVTLRSTTIIITIRIIILTVTLIAKGKVIGSIIRNIEGTLLTVTGEQQTSLGQTIGSSQALVVQAAEPGPAIGRVAELEQAIAPAAELALEIVREAELEQAIVPGVELEHGLVAEELGLVPGAAVPEHVLVAVELEHGPAGAVLARGRPHDRLAVPLGIKSVTALHHHGLAPVPAVEDLAAVVETTRELAAPEVVAAWAAAE
jgi:hypothetical protein